MVKIILNISLEGRAPNQDQIKSKVDQIKEYLFLTKEELSLMQFKLLIKEDQQIRNSLIQLGVIRESDFKGEGDEDLESELD